MMMILQIDNRDRRRNLLLARTILFIARTRDPVTIMTALFWPIWSSGAAFGESRAAP